jgi:hypothetical protein
VHNKQQQQQVWCVCNQQQETVHAQLTTSIACAQSTTTSECIPINKQQQQDVSVHKMQVHNQQHQVHTIMCWPASLGCHFKNYI